MRILVHGLNYRPELVGVGKYTAEMAEWLAAHGHAVRVVTAYPYYPQWRIAEGYDGGRYARETVAGVALLRCPLFVPGNQRAGARLMHLLSFAASSAPVLAAQAMRWRPDVVIAIAPTLVAAPASYAAARLCGAAAWLHVQDFEIEAAVATGLVTGSRLARWGTRLEGFLLRRFDHVSAISPAMCEHAGGKGVAAARIALVPNWVATGEIHPLGAPSPLRAELKLADDAIVALYAGNMSEKQGLDALVVTARALSGEPRLRLVFAGDGAARRRLAAVCGDLDGVTFLPVQPAERLNALLNLADIHLLPQRSGVADLVMPSKLLGMMASGRPVVAGAEPASALGQIVARCGIVVPPEDGAAMAAAVLALARDPERRAALGRSGRERVVAEWGRDAVLGRLARLLAELVSPPDAARAEVLSRSGGASG